MVWKDFIYTKPPEELGTFLNLRGTERYFPGKLASTPFSAIDSTLGYQVSIDISSNIRHAIHVSQIGDFVAGFSQQQG